MNKKKLMYLALLSLFLGIFLSGCANYAKIRWEPRRGQVTIQSLEENFKDYTVYKSDIWINHPVCLTFDIKNDDRRLAGNTWIKVEDKEYVANWIDWTRAFYHYPSIQSISGPDNQLYGYVFCKGYNRTVAKRIDDNTLYEYRPSQTRNEDNEN